jgi:hypothetical protein
MIQMRWRLAWIENGKRELNASGRRSRSCRKRIGIYNWCLGRMRWRGCKLKIIAKDVRACLELSHVVDIKSVRFLGGPSPTCNTYSSPSRYCTTLLVSMEGTVIPFAVTVIGAPFEYLGGGGRTLAVNLLHISAPGLEV